MILAFVFNFLALQDRGSTALVAVSNSQLIPGSVISVEDVRFVSIDSDFEGLSGLVDEATWLDVEGWVVTRPVDKDVPIDRALLARATDADGLGQMSIPVPIEHAAGGLLEVGDLVDVISVGDEGPVYVGRGLLVVKVGPVEGSGIGVAGDYHVVLAVDVDQALGLAGAINEGSIEVVRSAATAPGNSGEG